VNVKITEISFLLPSLGILVRASTGQILNHLTPLSQEPLASPAMNLSQPAKPLTISVLAPDLSGGGVTRVYILSQALQKLGHTVEVVGFQFGAKIYPDPPSGLRVQAVPGKELPNLLTESRHLLRHLRGDIIYAVKPRLTSLGAALLKKLYSSRPVFLDIDDWELSWMGGDEHKYRPTPKQLARDLLYPDGALRDPGHRIYIEWMENLVSKVNQITVNTQFLQHRFGGFYLPSGKDTNLFDPAKYDANAARLKYGLSKYRVLMFPGTVRPHKGVEDILTVLEKLNQPDFRLVIVGGRKPDNYEDQLIEQWGKWLIKLPQFPNEKMPEIVAAAHVVVVPQRDTTISQAQFPMKLTDGMAMAKPILATRVGDIPTILGETGYLVPPGDSAAMAASIQDIFADLAAAQYKGSLARQRCIDHYSLQAMGRGLHQVIAPLLL
jgi:glycosyltransferase involved in cell wall biosynthesis